MYRAIRAGQDKDGGTRGVQRAMTDGWTAYTRAATQIGFKGITNGLSNAVTSTHKMENVTRLPAGVTREAAVALLQDHDFFLRCDPHYQSHTISPPSAAAGTAAKAKAHYRLPAGVEPLGSPAVKCYEVIDNVENPFFSSNVHCQVEVADFEAGIFVRIRNTGGVVFDTIWSIRESPRQEGGKKDAGEGEEEEEYSGFELVQDATMSAPTPILAVVKAQVQKNRGGIHKKIVNRLVEDRDKARGTAPTAAESAVPAGTAEAAPVGTTPALA